MTPDTDEQVDPYIPWEGRAAVFFLICVGILAVLMGVSNG